MHRSILALSFLLLNPLLVRTQSTDSAFAVSLDARDDGVSSSLDDDDPYPSDPCLDRHFFDTEFCPTWSQLDTLLPLACTAVFGASPFVIIQTAITNLETVIATYNAKVTDTNYAAVDAVAGPALDALAGVQALAQFPVPPSGPLSQWLMILHNNCQLTDWLDRIRTATTQCAAVQTQLETAPGLWSSCTPYRKKRALPIPSPVYRRALDPADNPCSDTLDSISVFCALPNITDICNEFSDRSANLTSDGVPAALLIDFALTCAYMTEVYLILELLPCSSLPAIQTFEPFCSVDYLDQILAEASGSSSSSSSSSSGPAPSKRHSGGTDQGSFRLPNAVGAQLGCLPPFTACRRLDDFEGFSCVDLNTSLDSCGECNSPCEIDESDDISNGHVACVAGLCRRT